MRGRIWNREDSISSGGLAMIIGLWRDNGKERTPGKFHELWRLIIQHLWSQTLRFGLPEPPQYKTHPPHSLHPHWLCKSPRWIFHEVEFHLFDFSPLCVFLNVSQNDLLQRRHDYTGCISLTFLHCVFSNLSSNWINHLLQSSIRQVDKIFSLGAVTVPWFLLTKVVRCVVVLDKIKFNILCLMYEVLVLVLEFLGTGTWTPYMCWYLEVGIWYLVHGTWYWPERHMCTGTWRAHQGKQAPSILVAGTVQNEETVFDQGERKVRKQRGGWKCKTNLRKGEKRQRQKP